MARIRSTNTTRQLPSTGLRYPSGRHRRQLSDIYLDWLMDEVLPALKTSYPRAEWEVGRQGPFNGADVFTVKMGDRSVGLSETLELAMGQNRHVSRDQIIEHFDQLYANLVAIMGPAPGVP